MPDGSGTIPLAVARLRAGGVVAFPTETVYGLGAIATSEQAVAQVFTLKGRPSTNPLIVHVADAAQARGVTRAWPDEAQRLADAFWPGPLSLVLPRAACLPDSVTAGGDTVGVRCPNHPLALALLREVGPLVGPSANRSGAVSPTSAAHVRCEFDGRDVLVLDGGECAVGIESTVVVLKPDVVVLRPGAVSREQIEGVLGRAAAAFDALRPARAIAQSPGLMARHYAPRTRLLLASSASDLRDARGAGAIEVVLPREAGSCARGLYALLREGDARAQQEGAPMLVIAAPSWDAADVDAPLWEAIMDRLRRAATPER